MSVPITSRRRIREWFNLMPFENLSIIVPAIITIIFLTFLLSRDVFVLRSMLGELFTAYFGIVGVVSAALSQLQVVKLQGNVNHLVSMSLRPLEGFAEIFERAYTMLRDSDDEFYFASFVGRFGLLHEDNSEVVRAFRRTGLISGENGVSAKIDDFEELLIGKVTGFRKLRLVLLGGDKLKDVVERLPHRRGEVGGEQVDTKENAFRERLRFSLGARKAKTEQDCVTVNSLPQQVLVARMRRPNGDRVFGCLVFLVGTETEIQEQPIGYYTEAPSIASVYVRYLDAIAQFGRPL